MIKQNKYDIRNQRPKLHLIIYVSPKIVFWPKLTCGGPRRKFSQSYSCGGPQVSFGQKIVLAKIHMIRCSFSRWFRKSYLFCFSMCHDSEKREKYSFLIEKSSKTMKNRRYSSRLVPSVPYFYTIFFNHFVEKKKLHNIYKIQPGFAWFWNTAWHLLFILTDQNDPRRLMLAL